MSVGNPASTAEAGTTTRVAAVTPANASAAAAAPVAAAPHFFERIRRTTANESDRARVKTWSRPGGYSARDTPGRFGRNG